MTTVQEARRQLAATLVRYENDPLGFVRWVFPWGKPNTMLEHETGPDEWQARLLTLIGEDIEDDPWRVLREATSSGHGIGKSAVVSWLILWAMFTRPHTRGIVTANTDGQLRTKTWPEVSKWFNLLHPMLQGLFNLTATAIYSTDASAEKTWRIDAIPWSKSNPAAFAGLHNARNRILIIMDEASEIDDVIFDTLEGATTDADTQIIWCTFANPTQNTGRFKETVAGKFRHLWRARKIDSRTVKRTNKGLIKAWVDAWGEDSDFVRIRVRGEFPRVGSTQLIGSDLVMGARQRIPDYIPSDPIVAGLDVARFGDDKSVLQPRRGRDARTMPKVEWRGVDTMTLAGDVALWCDQWKPDALFVDVGGVGAGVFDRLMQLRTANVIPVNFGDAGSLVEFNGISVRVANKRAAMWCVMREWLRTGGAVADSPDLEADLTGVQYGFRGTDNAILLEAKEHMKARGLASPDEGDALALTFAHPVQPRAVKGFPNPSTATMAEYDIHSDLRG